nr:mucin-6-like [Crassostrea gigas]
MQFAVFLLFGIVGLSVQQCNNVNRCCRETARGFDCALKRDPCSCISLCGVADNKIVDIGRATHRIFASEKIIVHQQSSTVFTRMPCQEPSNSHRATHEATASETSATGGDDRSSSPSEDPVPSGEPVFTALPIQNASEPSERSEAPATSEASATSVAATGGRHFHTGLQRTPTPSSGTPTTTTPGSSSPQEEAGVETTGGRHRYPGREEEATTPVEEGARSTGRIGNSTHPSSTGSTPPDVSPSSTTLILVTSISISICLIITIIFIVIRRKRHTTIHRLPSPIPFIQESPIYTPPSPPLSIDMSTPLHTPSLFSTSTSSSEISLFDVSTVPAAASSKPYYEEHCEMSTFGKINRRVTRSMVQKKKD